MLVISQKMYFSVFRVNQSHPKNSLLNGVQQQQNSLKQHV